MQSSPRIEELRQKFHENPRRYFAPLANEYRKAGDPEQAIAICRAHLAQQPGHMSGHVVYGQALYDAQRMDEAHTVFERALALDPENIIVLRHLGDIARQRGDVEEARNWYSRALDGDPNDAETAAYLAELTEPLTTAPAAEPEVLSSQPEIAAPEEAVSPEPAAPEFETVSPVPAAAGPPEAEAATALAEEIGMDSDLQLVTDEPLVSPYAREMELSAPTEMKLELNDSPYLEIMEAATPEEAAESAAEISETPPEASVTAPEVSETAPQVNASAPEVSETAPEVSDLTAGVAEVAEAAQAPVEEAGAAETQQPLEDETEKPTHRTPSRPTTPVSESAPIVTRTLAELYLEQGYIEPALEIYRQLAEREPEDVGIQNRIDELTSEDESQQSYAETVGEAATVEEVAAASVPEAVPEPEEHFWDSSDAWGDRPFIDTDSREEIFGLAEDIEQSGLTPERAETPPPPPEPMGATELEPEPVPQEPEPEPEPKPDARAGKKPITVREFFATLGAVRVPGRELDEAPVTDDYTDQSTSSSEEKSGDEKTYPIADDAFANLFAGVPVTPEDSRAAAALSGAVAHGAPFSTPLPSSATVAPRASQPAQTTSSPAQESEEDIRRFREWLDGLAES